MHVGILIPPKALSSATAPPKGYSPHGSPAGFPHRRMETASSRPPASTRSSVETLCGPRAHSAVTVSSPLARQVTLGSRNAAGVHTASPARRPAALRSTSDPSACMIGTCPSSRHCTRPVLPRSGRSREMTAGPSRCERAIPGPMAATAPGRPASAASGRGEIGPAFRARRCEKAACRARWSGSATAVRGPADRQRPMGRKVWGPDVGRVSRSHDFTAEGAARPASRAGNGGTVFTFSNPTVFKARSRLSA
jgi:hypothetical protein